MSSNIIFFSVFQITCHDNKDGTVAVSYLPTAPGEYKISVRFGDKHIKGSPYTAKVYQDSDNIIILADKRPTTGHRHLPI